MTPPKDDDPDGAKLLQAEDRLERAAKFLNPLTTHASNNIDAWIAIYDVAIRRSMCHASSGKATSTELAAEKYLQAVQALNRARALDETHPELHVRLIHFRKTSKSLLWMIRRQEYQYFRVVSSLPQEPPSPIGPVLSEAGAELLPADTPLDTFNSQFLQKHPGSPRSTLAFAKALRVLGAPIEEVESSLFGLLHTEANLDVKVSVGHAVVSALT